MEVTLQNATVFDAEEIIEKEFKLEDVTTKEATPVKSKLVNAVSLPVKLVVTVLDKSLVLLRKIPLVGRLFGRWSVGSLLGQYSEGKWWRGLVQTVARAGFKRLVQSFVDALQGSVSYYLKGNTGEVPDSELQPKSATTSTSAASQVFSSPGSSYPKPSTTYGNYAPPQPFSGNPFDNFN